MKAVYHSNVYSAAAFSNTVTKLPPPTGILTGWVHYQDQPVIGAVVVADILSAITDMNGSYLLNLQSGNYCVTCTAGDYLPFMQDNISVTAGLTTILNIDFGTVSGQESNEASVTVLGNNYPNPFNPETTISYEVKNRTRVCLDVYNIKGQLIRTLVNDVKDNGRYSVVWDGKDQDGNSIASGIYMYRMQAGEYHATHRMMLMK